MDEGRFFGRGIAFPPRLGEDGRLAFSAGPRNIRESIQIILLTELGERLRLEDFGGGLRTFLFEPNTVATRRLLQDRIFQALMRWEPRIRTETVEVEADPESDQVVIVTIYYQLVATQAREQVRLAVNLTG